MSHPKLIHRLSVSWLMKNVFFYAALCLALSFITACDYAKTQTTKTKADPPPFAQVKPLPIEQIREIAKPITPEGDLQVNDPNLKDAEKRITSTGFKTDILFENKNLTIEERFDRLEKTVQMLSEKLLKIDPVIQRLVSIDNDLDGLTSQLEILLQNDANNKSIPVLKQVEPQIESRTVVPPKAVKQEKRIIRPENKKIAAPVKVNIKSVIRNIRAADHRDKTRIVFDSDQKINPIFSFDDVNNLIIQFPKNQKIDFQNIKINEQSAFIEKITAGSTQSIMVLHLNQPMQKRAQGHIAPSEQNEFHRLYIDLIQ